MAYPSYPRFSGESLAATNPIGFADSIASLGNLIDALDQRRQAKARQDEMLALQQRDREIAQARESRQEAQGMRKSKADWTKHNVGQKSLADARAARGGSAEPLYMYDDEGNLRTFNPEAIQQEPMAPPDASGVDLPPLPPGGPQDIDSALQGAGGAPGAPELPPAAPQPPIETLQGTAPGPETMAMLNALPFGGGKPAPATPAPQAPPAAPPPGPAPQAGSATMRPPIVRGASYKALPELATVENLTEAQLDAGPPGAPAQAPKGQRVVYRGTPLGDITIDQEQARNDLRAQREFEAEGIQQQLADPNLDPAIRQQLERQLAIVKGGIPPKPGQTILAQAGMTSRQQSGISSKEGMQRTGIAAGQDLEKIKQQGRIDLKRTPKAGGGRSSAMARASSLDPTTGANNPWAAMESKMRSREGVRLNREFRDWATNHGWTKLLSTNPGRLEWAAKNIRVSGADAGAAQAEAMFNLFGVARGGVPVENETKEFYKNVTSLKNTMDRIGASIGFPHLGTRLASGEFLSEEDRAKYNKAVSAMPPDVRASIEAAIESTSEALVTWGRRTISTLKTKWDVEPLANRYKGTAFLNELGAHLGMEPRQWWGDVPLFGEQKQGVVAPASAGGKMSDEQLIEALKGMK